MARTHGASARRVRMWRWRKNPLRRRSDLVEGWLLLATFLLAVLLGGIAGLAAAGAVDDAIDARRERVRPVTAVLVENAGEAAPSPVSGDRDGHVRAKVRWTAPDGTARTGQGQVEPRSRAGTEVTVHTDSEGRLVPAPTDGGEARFQILMAGTTVAVGTGGLVLLGGWVVRSRLQWRRLNEWETEWQQVEPAWRKRMID